MNYYHIKITTFQYQLINSRGKNEGEKINDTSYILISIILQKIDNTAVPGTKLPSIILVSPYYIFSEASILSYKSQLVVPIGLSAFILVYNIYLAAASFGSCLRARNNTRTGCLWLRSGVHLVQ